MKKLFNHPNYQLYANRYEVSDDGNVFNHKTGNYLKLNKNPKTEMRFVRLSAGKGNCLSIGVARLMLFTFSPQSYFEGAIAIHCDGKQQNNYRNNLIWGTRKMQSKIQMSNPSHAKKVKMMARKYFGKEKPIIADDKKVIKMRLSGMSSRAISKIFDCHEQTISAALHRNGYKTINGKLIKIK